MSEAEKNLTAGVSALRFVASIVALGAIVSTLMLWSYTEADYRGIAQRPFVGLGIAVASFGIGLCALLLFIAAWADRWTDLEYAQRIERERSTSRSD